MDILSTRERVAREVELMPEEYLADVFRLLHFFRLGIGNQPGQRNKAERILQFAGSWGDWQESEFSDFLAETANRRQTAFSERRRA